jgi:hypothetical protein
LSQIRNELQQGLKQHEDTLVQTLANHEQRMNNMRVDLNVIEEQVNQRLIQVRTSK